MSSLLQQLTDIQSVQKINIIYNFFPVTALNINNKDEIKDINIYFFLFVAIVPTSE